MEGGGWGRSDGGRQVRRSDGGRGINLPHDYPSSSGTIYMYSAVYTCTHTNNSAHNGYLRVPRGWAIGGRIHMS